LSSLCRPYTFPTQRRAPNDMGFVPSNSALHSARFMVALALGLACGLLRLPPASAANRDVTGQPIYDIVAVGLARGEILLATPVGRTSRLVWRFRKIALSPPSGTARSVVLSSTGTKALVVFPDGTPRVLDLTQRITEVVANELPPPQHRLPKQLFPYAEGGRVCLLDDLGSSDSSKCRDATAAAVHEDGCVLYAFSDGRLVAVAPDGSQEKLPYRLPTGLQWELLAGHRSDRRDFLVLVTHPTTSAGNERAVGTTEVIDPRRPATFIARYADPNVAGLRAQLDFEGAESVETAPKNAARLDDATLAALAQRLEREPGHPDVTWSFYRVSPDPELYAPVLELAPGEPDFPSDVGIWEEIRPLAHGTTRQAYEEAYASLGDRRWSRCTAYVRSLSYPGTWLIEYWYYYPFDEGKPHAHIHDSEHIFIEVDKLGGTVRNVFASDHNGFVPNNLYSVLVKDAPPVALPLYATVELAKHAMAPDLNHDGRFTRGVDDNLHPESHAVWGLRDLGKKKGDLMEPYRAGMSLPRSPGDRFALSDTRDLFPGFDASTGHQVCRLEPLPDDQPCNNCDVATSEAAMAHLVAHSDAQTPENIYKPYVLPWREVRLGVAPFGRSVNYADLSVALVGDVRHLTREMVRVPMRLSLEYMFSHSKSTGGSVSMMHAGPRLERMVTNTQGFYFGVTPEWISVQPGPWQYSGIWYRAGYVLELPSKRWGNLTNHIGVMFHGSMVRFEWRVSLGILRQRGRHDFGARPNDRNPYQ